MKFALAFTFVAASLALAACNSGFKATSFDIANPAVLGVDGEEILDNDKTVTVGEVEAVAVSGPLGLVKMDIKGNLIGSGQFDLDLAKGDQVECLNTPEGIKITASSKEWMDSKLSIEIPAGTEIPSKILVGNKSPVTKMTLTISEDTGLYTVDRTEEKCILVLDMAPKSDILLAKVSCPMDELKLDKEGKLQLLASIRCNLTGSQVKID